MILLSKTQQDLSMTYPRYAGLMVLSLLALLFVTGCSSDLPINIVENRYRSPTSQFLITEPGLRIHYRDEGDPEGQPIVLIHGAFSSLHAFEAWRAILGDQYRIISHDLPGHGLTGATPDGIYSNTIHLQAVNSVTQHLELGRFTLGGHSMGGGVSWRYALQYPERIEAVILIASSGPARWHSNSRPHENASQRPRATQLLEHKWFRAVAGNINPYYLVKWGLASAYHQQQHLTEAVTRRYTDMILRAGTRKAILARSRTRQNNDKVGLDPALLKQPVLILWGQEDRWIDISMGQRLASRIANSQLIIYPDVGHLPMEEIPSVSAKSVRDFLNELNPGR